MSPEIEELVAQVEQWGREREPLARKGRPGGKAGVDSLREFTETMRYRSKKLVSLLGTPQDPNFWSALRELAMDAETMTAKGRLIVDGHDRSNL